MSVSYLDRCAQLLRVCFLSKFSPSFHLMPSTQKQPMVPTYDPTYYPTRSPTLEPTLSVSIRLYELEYLSHWSSFHPLFRDNCLLISFPPQPTAHSLANIITYNLADAGTYDRANCEPNGISHYFADPLACE